MTEKNEKGWSRRGALTGLAAAAGAIGAAGAVGTSPLPGHLTPGAGPPTRGGTPPVGAREAPGRS